MNIISACANNNQLLQRISSDSGTPPTGKMSVPQYHKSLVIQFCTSLICNLLYTKTEWLKKGNKILPSTLANLLSGWYYKLNNLLPLRKKPVKIKLKKPVAIAASVFGISAGLLFGLSPINYARAQQADRFSCEDLQGIPTTIFKTADGEKQLIAWDSEYFSKAGYTPQVRCLQVTNRLNRFFNSRSENALTSGTVTVITKNGTLKIPVIFVEDENTGQKSLLYTLKPGQDGDKAIDLLIGQLNFVKTNTPPLREGKCHKSLSLNSVLQGRPQVRCI